MQNFLFDLTAAQTVDGHIFHGAGKYAKKLFLELIFREPREWMVYAIFDSSKPVDTELRDGIKRANNVELVDIHARSVAETISELNIRRLYTAMPYNLAYNFTSLLNLKPDIYATIHGLRALETSLRLRDLADLTYRNTRERLKLTVKAVFSGYFQRKEYQYFRLLLARLHVIAASDHTKYAILAHYPTMTPDIKVFYSPDVTNLHSDTEDQQPISVPHEKYFLLVGGSRWIKNNLRAALALDKLFDERPLMKGKVVITGVSNAKAYRKKLKNQDRFILYGYVSERELRSLYQHAHLLIFMSLNEGFGYPPLEAMQFGVPVIANAHTSIAEICGDAAMYSNPLSIPEIKNRILQLEDPETHQKLKLLGRNRFEIIQSRQIRDLQSMIDYLLSQKSENRHTTGADYHAEKIGR